MKKLSILAAICLPLLFAGCEKRIIDTSVTLYGTIYDAETFSPIQGAHISLQPSGKDCYTGSDGTYQLDELDSNQYTITASATGYRTDRRTVHLTAGEKNEVSFSLYKL